MTWVAAEHDARVAWELRLHHDGRAIQLLQQRHGGAQDGCLRVAVIPLTPARLRGTDRWNGSERSTFGQRCERDSIRVGMPLRVRGRLKRHRHRQGAPCPRSVPTAPGSATS